MPRTNHAITVPVEIIENRIQVIRGQRVMLDDDLSKLYEIPTGRLNEQVRRNKKRFPRDFAFRLTPQEFRDLRSQIAISNIGRGGRRYLPWAFTEHGVAMLSSVLNSPRAIQVNIEIMRAFIRLRRLLATPGELVAQLTKLAETVQLHDHQIKAIADVLERMLEPPPPEPPKQRFGFHVPESQPNSRKAMP